jgi:hypothetical protein
MARFACIWPAPPAYSPLCPGQARSRAVRPVARPAVWPDSTPAHPFLARARPASPVHGHPLSSCMRARLRRRRSLIPPRGQPLPLASAAAAAAAEAATAAAQVWLRTPLPRRRLPRRPFPPALPQQRAFRCRSRRRRRQQQQHHPRCSRRRGPWLVCRWPRPRRRPCRGSLWRPPGRLRGRFVPLRRATSQ